MPMPLGGQLTAHCDVVGVGVNTVDVLAVGDAFPAPDTKHELRALIELPGGETATALAACARLGWRARYVGRFGSDLRGQTARVDLANSGVDVSSCTTAAAVGAAALWDRERGGERRDADVSAVEAHSGNVDTTFTAWSLNQGIAPTSATRSVRIFPVGTYRCSDGFVQFTAGEPPFFQRSCVAIGHPEWPEDPRFRDPETRADYHDDYMEAFLPWIGERTKLQVFREMQDHGVLCTPVLSVQEAIAEPVAAARHSFVTVEQPVVGEMLLAGAPFRLGGVEGDAWRALPAPRLGEHSAELLDELGYSRDEQIALFRAGVTG